MYVKHACTEVIRLTPRPYLAREGVPLAPHHDKVPTPAAARCALLSPPPMLVFLPEQSFRPILPVEQSYPLNLI